MDDSRMGNPKNILLDSEKSTFNIGTRDFCSPSNYGVGQMKLAITFERNNTEEHMTTQNVCIEVL